MLVVAINDHGENEIKMESVKAVTSGIHDTSVSNSSRSSMNSLCDNICHCLRLSYIILFFYLRI